MKTEQIMFEQIQSLTIKVMAENHEEAEKKALNDDPQYLDWANRPAGYRVMYTTELMPINVDYNIKGVNDL